MRLSCTFDFLGFNFFYFFYGIYNHFYNNKLLKIKKKFLNPKESKG